MNPATGSSLHFALGKEIEFGVPGGGLLGYRVRLPVKAGLVGAEGASGSVNQSGYVEPGIPSTKGGTLEWGIPLRVGYLPEYLEHILGFAEAETLETGVYRYTFTPRAAGVNTSFYSLYSTPPVERWWLHGIKIGSLDAEIGDNTEIPVKLQGVISHGTRLGAAVPGAGNTGTYTLGPLVRGVLKDRSADVHVTITRVVGGVQFKVEQTNGVPTFPGAAVDAILDPESGRGTWQNLQGATGLDLGLWDENKDPLELIWPGEPSDHAGLAVGDTYRFPVSWADPVVPTLSGHQRMTSAHWQLNLRNIGSPTWISKRVNTGKWSIDWSVSPDRGNLSRYPFGVIRDGRLTPTLELQRTFVDSFFADKVEAHQRLEGQLLLQGRQLGSGLHREGMTLTYASLRLDANERQAANEKAIDEKLKLTGETNEDGDPPLIVQVITSRSWTPTPLP